MEVFFGILIAIIILVILNIKIVPETKAYVIERLGHYKETWLTGIHIKIPFIERIANTVSLKEKVRNTSVLQVVTKDAKINQIDVAIHFKITDPKLYTYSCENTINALESLITITLINEISNMEQHILLNEKAKLSQKIKEVISKSSDAWGIEINVIEVVNIIPLKLKNKVDKKNSKPLKREKK